jgi:hypothetical protein
MNCIYCKKPTVTCPEIHSTIGSNYNVSMTCIKCSRVLTMKVVPIENYKSWAERLFVEINEYVDLMSY